MGWLFKTGSTRRGLIDKLTNGWELPCKDVMLVKSTCIAHCYRGGNFSGVLWGVWERTFTRNGEQVQPTERWITCDLLQYRTNDGWGYKDMDESMGPFYYSCPLKYLDLVPVVANEEWRKCVRSHHARAIEKRRERSRRN